MATLLRTPVVSATPRRLQSRSTLSGPDLMQSYSALDDDHSGPLLDFTDMVAAVTRFQRKFRAYTENAIASINEDKADFDSNRLQHNNHLHSLDREIEEAKATQKQLWDTVAEEREADAQVRSRIQALTSQRASLSQRSAELQTEISEARTKLEARRKAKEEQRQRLKAQVDQNGPELKLLEARTGCSIQPTKVGDQLRFTFNLVNADDWAAECYFVIDVSRPQYAVSSHQPELPKAVFEPLVAELNSTRKFYTFVKQMRKVLGVEVEKRRLEARDAARRAAS